MPYDDKDLAARRPWLRFYRKDLPADIDRPMYEHIPDIVRRTAAKFSNLPAFTLCMPSGAETTLSFRDVDDLSDAFAVYLREDLGLRKGDRLAIQLENDLAYPIAVFGALKAACIIVNTNPLYTPFEMNHQFKDSGAKTIVIDERFGDKLNEAIPGTDIERAITTDRAAFFPLIPRTMRRMSSRIFKREVVACPSRVGSLSDAIARGRAIIDERGIDPSAYVADMRPDDIAILQYTGGTTGVSKGAMLTHGNMTWHTTTSYTFYKPMIEDGQETIVTVLPLYHIFAFAVNFITLFQSGARNILIPDRRPLSNLRPAFEHHTVTWLTGVNTLLAGLLNEPWFVANPPRRIKVTIGGGAAVHASVAERWHEVVGSPIYEGYGLTETAPAICFSPIGAVRTGFIGIPISNMEVKIVKDDGTEAAPGEAGELVAKSPQIMPGYWKRPDETEKVLKNGWFATGDIATMDKDGYFRIVDRKKDMIIVSGFNVFPNEIEDCIAKLPGVAEVAVIGIPFDKTGEKVKAFVVRTDDSITADDVETHCRKQLTAYKIPKDIEFRRELPKSTVGKLLRRELRAEALRTLNG